MLPAAAQGVPVVPTRPLHALNPSHSLGSRPSSPVEQQIQQNYRTDLLQSQRELMQANPSGLGRTQIEIGHQLNNFNAAPH